MLHVQTLPGNRIQVRDATGTVLVDSINSDPEKWHHVHFTHHPGKTRTRVYINGVEQGWRAAMRRTVYDFKLGFKAMFGDGRAPFTAGTVAGCLTALAVMAGGSVVLATALWWALHLSWALP